MLLKVVLIVLMSEMSIQAHQHSEPVVNNDVFLERFYNLIEELEIVIKEGEFIFIIHSSLCLINFNYSYSI